MISIVRYCEVRRVPQESPLRTSSGSRLHVYGYLPLAYTVLLQVNLLVEVVRSLRPDVETVANVRVRIYKAYFATMCTWHNAISRQYFQH